MDVKKLTSSQKKAILSDIVQAAVLVIVLSGIMAVVYFTITYVISENTFPVIRKNQDSLLILFQIFFIIGFIIIIIVFLWKPIYELYIGKCLSVQGKVVSKKIKTNYGWHGNPSIDKTSQPKLLEHYIFLKDTSAEVDKEFYDLIEIGDQIEITYSYLRKKILQVQKLGN